MRTDLKLTPEDIKAIEAVLAQDERVMLIPKREGFIIVRVRHETVKIDPKTEYLTKF